MQKIGFENLNNITVQNKSVKQNPEQLKNKLMRKACATGLCAAPSLSILLGKEIFEGYFSNKMLDTAKSMSNDERNAISACIDKVLEKAKLTNLIKIENITSKTKIPDDFSLNAQQLQELINGTNAFCAGGKIYINQDISPNLLLHELGHAHSNHFSKLSNKLIPYYASFKKIPFIIAFASLLLSEEKPKDGGELTKFQKAKNVFRKALPFVAVVPSLPCVVEEGMASAKAGKWAKEYLSPKVAKKVIKSYKFGFLTYVATPIAAFLISFFGAKLKDFLERDKADKKVQTQNCAQK